MKGPNGYRIMMNSVMGFLMSVGIALISLGVTSAKIGVNIITLPTVANIVIVCFVVGYVVGDVIPVFALGNGLADKLHVEGISRLLVVAATMGLCLGVCVGLLGGYILNYTGGLEAVQAFYAENLVVIIVSAIVLAMLLLGPVMGLVSRITEFDPQAAAA